MRTSASFAFGLCATIIPMALAQTTTSTATPLPTGYIKTNSANATVNNLYGYLAPSQYDVTVQFVSSNSTATLFSINSDSQLTSPAYSGYVAAQDTYYPPQTISDDTVALVPEGQAVQGGLPIMNCSVTTTEMLSCMQTDNYAGDTRHIFQACGGGSGAKPYLVFATGVYEGCTEVTLDWVE